MYEYFNMLKSVADLDNTEYNIKDLTIEIANKAGYYRAPYTFDNGNTRIRTFYKAEFDDVLTAKWLMYYKNLFIGKLKSHPEFGTACVDIINSTFFMVMNCLDIEKLKEDKVLTRYVNLALSGRIKNYLIEIGSKKRLEEYENGQKLNMRLNKSVLNQAYSLDDMKDNLNFDMYDYTNDFGADDDFSMAESMKLLKENPMGIRLLNALLDAGKKVHVSRIDEYMPMEEEEKTDLNLFYLKCAYCIIKNALKTHSSNRFKYNFNSLSDEQIGFSTKEK